MPMNRKKLRWEDIGQEPDLPTGIYTRRSNDDQSSYSPAAQENIGRNYCQMNQLKVVDVYLDDDYSGTNGRRPNFERMLKDAQDGRIRVVVVPKMDRFARDVILCLQTYDRLRALGVVVISVAEPLNFDTPMGRKFLTDAASSAEWYSRNLGTEVSKGYAQKFVQGGWIGPLPLGYDAQFDIGSKGDRIKGTGRAVFSADISTVRLVFELYATGNHSDLTIAEELNGRGLTTIWKGKRVPFQKDTIKTMLQNRFYLGFVTYKGEERPGAHAPAIDRDLWDRCQAVRTRRGGTPGGRLPIRGIGALLSEIAYCGKCGARMHTAMCGSDASRQRYYRCSTRRKFGKEVCDADFVPATWIEQQVLDVLRALTIPASLRDAVIGVVQDRLTRQASGPGPDTAQLAAQLERLKELYELGDLDRAAYLQRRGRIQSQIEQATPTPKRTLDVSRAMTLLGDMSALLDTATTTQKRALIQQVFTTIWVEKSAVTAIRPAHSYALLVEVMWQKRSRRGSNPQPSAPEADALSN